MRWWYRVTATNGSGSSVYSNIATVVNKPSAPYGGQVIAMSTSELSLSWRDSSGDIGYRIERFHDNFPLLAHCRCGHAKKNREDDDLENFIVGHRLYNASRENMGDEVFKT